VKLAGVSADRFPVGGVIVTPVRGLSDTATVAVLPATFAVIVDFCVVTSETVATPDASVTALPAERLPTSAVNVTEIPATPAPLTSSTRA
jgi:hypothetical protein